MKMAQTAAEAQLLEARRFQIEEVARISGVPRPLLMMDETSWGSGIEALGRFFVTFALNPWFEAWQQACEGALLTDAEQDTLAIKFNPAALLRGSMKEQGDFLGKALGAGGSQPWMSIAEARGVMDLPDIDPAKLPARAGAATTKDAPDDEQLAEAAARAVTARRS